MVLSWNEIRTRASTFVNEWQEIASKAREEADAQDFQTDFLSIFGVSRRQVATFEHRVEMQGKRGYIDLFWKGRFMIEMKTPGKDRKKAYEQAKEYAENLPPKDLPQGILISDFLNFDYYDLENNTECFSFPLAELSKHVELFSYLAGYKDIKFEAIDPVDIEAAERMGELHDALKESGYQGHDLEMYLVRLLFCLFADDTGIFDEKKLFYKYIMEKTKEDGSDLASQIGHIFETLNEPKETRLKNIDESLNKFTYVNGNLFEERLKTAGFNSNMRNTLLKCCSLDWSQIKPEIFGAMFQSVKDKDKRRALGEHYTSETNILKVIRPLFLDSLWDEFEKIRKLSYALKKDRLLRFHTNLRKLKFLDPACGCGNFLIVTYRELRLLEIEVIAELYKDQQFTDITLMINIDVDQFYGIEIEEFPARIAQTALWLMDHLMNTKTSARFGNYFARIPLTTAPAIRHGNALANGAEFAWEDLISKNDLSYILGNPPFVGYKQQTEKQKKELDIIFHDNVSVKTLDYVTAWFIKAANYIQGTDIQVAFVATNSICQGEQAIILWNSLFNKLNIKINFAHQTFKWSNEARGVAGVNVIIVGFATHDTKKQLFIYDDLTSDPYSITAKTINHYLIDADSIFITKKSKPLCNVPKMQKGNEMYDDRNLIIEADEYEDFIKKEPLAEKYIKRYMGSEEFINNKKRYCIWLVDVEPSEIKKMPHVMTRIEAVKKFRLASKREATKKTAATPAMFSVIHQPKTDYILFPVVSGESRDYIPIGFVSKEVIVSYAVFTIPNATLYHFGILTSAMHMAWTKYICGRLGMSYRYSNDLVYNNFPWPNLTDKQKMEIEKCAKAVLDVRTKYSKSSLADLYDPLSMPTDLVKAHQKLDKAVENAYGRSFDNEGQRVAYLFELYQKLTGDIFVEEKKRGKGRKKN